jgi:hypothetical protein
MAISHSVTELIKHRYSCRSYSGATLDQDVNTSMESYLSGLSHGPFGSPLRFTLVAAKPGDGSALNKLGTYGFIKGASAYIIGTVDKTEKNLEDYGYVMENIILHATGLGLGTCWLGGSFDKSGFARKINCASDECVPAVAALGYKADKRRLFDSSLRLIAGSARRKSFEEILFDRDFTRPLDPEQCGPFAAALAMIRLAPSASNKQP